jgi:hypothetical protein
MGHRVNHVVLTREQERRPSPGGVGAPRQERAPGSSGPAAGALLPAQGPVPRRPPPDRTGTEAPRPLAQQWGLVSQGAKSLAPAHEELIRHAARGEVLFDDDTTMKVLELAGEQRAAGGSSRSAPDRRPGGRTPRPSRGGGRGALLAGRRRACPRPATALLAHVGAATNPPGFSPSPGPVVLPEPQAASTDDTNSTHEIRRKLGIMTVPPLDELVGCQFGPHCRDRGLDDRRLVYDLSDSDAHPRAAEGAGARARPRPKFCNGKSVSFAGLAALHHKR